ncbi:MAG: hypothetical protein HY719_12735 [Planctomycetes bacterium]|nr:hypothetical protein [Planctomycetota bacterium]
MPVIEQGLLLHYFCFDVGDEIDLDRVPAILGESASRAPLVCQRLTPVYVQYQTTPLLIRLGEMTLATGKRSLRVDCRVKAFTFGVMVVVFRSPLAGPLEDLAALATELVGNPEVRRTARAQVDRLAREIAPAVKRARYAIPVDVPDEHEWQEYAMFAVQKFAEPISPREIMRDHGVALGRLLRCELEPLSEGELADAVRRPLSYYADDLAVVDWHAAFLLDPRRSYDVPDVLEYAAVMFLELRRYDLLLDQVLAKAYDDLEQRRGAISLRPFARTIDFLSAVKLDVSEVVEKVTNFLKLVGDLYLAKVFNAAADRFSLKAWEESLREKLATVESLYTLLHDRTHNRQMLILELAVVALFVLDIVMLFVDRLP